MKLATAILSVALSSQALADCATDQPEPSSGDSAVIQVADDATAAQRRQMALDCLMRPTPFVQEPLVIELDDIEDEFIEAAEPYQAANKTVAVNS